MAQKRRGPGRPVNPGPTIQSSSNVGIPNEMIENFILESLDDAQQQLFEELPKKSKDIYIGSIKNALYGFRNSTGGPNGSNILNYGDEFQDRSGVQVSLSLNPQDWTRPTDYLKKTVHSWVVGGLFNFDDYSREVEKGIVSSYLKKGGTGLYSTKAKRTGPLPIQDSESNLLDVTATGKVVGRGGKADYVELSKAVEGWINDSRGLLDRNAAIQAYTEAAQRVIEKEFYNRGVGVVGAVRNFNADTNDIAQRIEQDLASTNAYAKGYLTGFERSSAFRNAVTGSVLSTGFTVENDLDWLKVNGRHLKNSHYWRTRADSILKSSLTYDLNTRTFSGSLDPLRLHMRANWQALGFTSADRVDAIFAKFSGKNLEDINKNFVSSGIFSDRSFTTKEIATFRSAVGALEGKAKSIQKSIQDFQEKEIFSNPAAVVDYLTADIADAAVRDRVKKDLKAAIKWKQYIHLRSTMLAQQEFITAINKGDVYKLYFFLGSSGIKQLAKWDRVKGKLDKIQIGRGGATLGDVVKNWGSIKHVDLENSAEVAKALKQLRLNPIRLLAYKAGLASEGITYSDAPLLQKLLPGKLVGNHAYLYTSDFANRTVEIGKSGVKLNLFANQNTFNSLKSYDSAYAHSGLTKVNPSTLLIYAHQLQGLDDVFDAISFLADSMKLAGAGAYFNPDDVGNAFKFIKQTYGNVGNMDFLDTWGHWNTLDAATRDRYKTGFEQIFKALDKIKNEMASKGLTLDDNEMFSLIMVLSKEKGFLSKSGKLMRYMSVLDAIGSHLSAAQTFMYEFVEKKLLIGIKGSLGKGVRKLWGWYNPGIGAIERAQGFVNTKFGSVALRVVNKAITPILTKLGFSAIAIGTAGTGYIAILISGALSALARGAWNTIRHLDLMAIPKALAQEFNNLVVNPTKFIIKVALYIIAIPLLFFAFFILIFSTGSVAQYDRDYSLDAYLGTLYDDPLLACKTDFKGEAGVLFVSALDSNPTAQIETSCFGWRQSLVDGVSKYNFHKGIDYGIPLGTPIESPIRGTSTVTFAGWNSSGYGNLVVLKDNRSETYVLLAHMDTILVTKGQEVTHRQQVGTVGDTGYSTGPHLHYEIRMGGSSISHAVNPCAVFSCQSKCASFSGESLNGKGGCYTDYAP